MRVIRLDEKQNELKLEPQSLEDLWALAKLVEEGDVVAGDSFRRFKVPGIGRADSGEKKKVFVELRVEQIEFAEASNKLRLTGRILGGSPEEYVQSGDFHTLDVEVGTRLVIKKELNVFHRKILEQAVKRSRQVQARIIVLDNEKALVAELNARGGVSFLYSIDNEANKREPKTFEELKKKFFGELLKAVTEAKTGKGRVIVAGPGFAKDDFRKFVSQKAPEALPRMVFETTSNAEESGVYELLKKGVLKKLLGEQRLEREYEVFEEFKKRIAKEGLAIYGPAEVRRAVEANAAEKLLVADELLRKNKAVQEIVSLAESKGAETIIFDSGDAAGKEFSGFGIAAFLRYRFA